MNEIDDHVTIFVLSDEQVAEAIADAWAGGFYSSAQLDPNRRIKAEAKEAQLAYVTAAIAELHARTVSVPHLLVDHADDTANLPPEGLKENSQCT